MMKDKAGDKRTTEHLTEQQWTEQFQMEMNKLDDEDYYPVPLPDLHSLEHWVVQQKQQLRRKLARDLLLFWLSALIILGSLVSVAYKELMLVVWLQIPILLVALAGFYGSQAKRKRKRVHKV